jgi:L-lysine exporter family protein LysE/ArgO
MLYFIQGLTMGLAYVAPIGLQNLFVVNTALTQTRSRTYLTVLIVIFFDVTLALACFFGIGAIMSQSEWLELIILGIGSLIVIYIGITLLRDKGTDDRETNVNVSILKVIGTACVVTWFNPQALIDGSMMLGAFKASLPAAESTKFIIGVACASCLWFAGIATVISFFSAKITPKVLRVINIICGVVIVFYGVKLGVNFVQLLLKMFS